MSYYVAAYRPSETKPGTQYIETYGKGPTLNLAMNKCKLHMQAKRHAKYADVIEYREYKMPKPKFKPGQKVKRIKPLGMKDVADVAKVAYNADGPMTVGNFMTNEPPTFGLFKVWEAEDKWEAA